MSYFTLLSLSQYVSYLLTCCVCFSKVKELEEELHVVTNSLRSLEISENKVCGGQLTTLYVIDVKQSPQSKNLNKVFRLWSLLGQHTLNHSLQHVALSILNLHTSLCSVHIFACQFYLTNHTHAPAMLPQTYNSLHIPSVT